jgi:hypothetical protein
MVEAKNYATGGCKYKCFIPEKLEFKKLNSNQKPKLLQ